MAVTNRCEFLGIDFSHELVGLYYFQPSFTNIDVLVIYDRTLFLQLLDIISELIYDRFSEPIIVHEDNEIDRDNLII